MVEAEQSKKLVRYERMRATSFFFVATATLVLAITLGLLVRQIDNRQALNACQFRVTVIVGRGLASLSHNDSQGVNEAGNQLDRLVGTSKTPKEC